MRRYFRLAFRTILACGLLAGAVPIAVTTTVLASMLFLPLPANLPEPRPPEGGQVSRVYDQNGEEIGQFREFEQNIPVKKSDIPLVLKQAVISAEDRSFYRHGGIDLRGSVRALVVDVRGGQIQQGGSTITQQYVKNAYVGKERTIIRKVREAIIAAQLDRQAEKDDILFKYLSTIYLGEGAIGVGAASQGYFRKPVSELTLSEAALLAGLIPAPSRYEPRGNPQLADQRRRLVLRQMLEQDYITQEQHDAAAAEPVIVLPPNTPPPPPPVTIIWPTQQQISKYPYFVDYVRRYLVSKYGAETVFRGGLKIQTTLDPKVQDAAEAAVAASLRGTAPPIDMALASVEPPTGFVKALVGGRDFEAPGGQVNLALGHCPDMTQLVQEGDQVLERPVPDEQIAVRASCHDEGAVDVEGGGTGRQPGSSWKPFVLAAAFEKGIPPTKVYPAPGAYRIPGCQGANGCTIQNYEGASAGSTNLRNATVRSYNTVYAQVIQDVGIKETADMARRLGITTAWAAPNVRHGISYSLGVQEVAPLEMAAAYGTIANRGVRLTPTPIFRIEDAQGNVLEDNSNREGERVLEEIVADNVTDVLRGVISGGTGTRANIGRPAAGKTGTAENYQDAWFVGYTPTLAAAVWIGNRDKPTPMYGIAGVSRVAGGTIPAGTWKTFMSRALEGVPATEFNEPAPITVITDKLNRERRTGIDPGNRRSPAGTPEGGPYQVGPGAPEVNAPAATTTSTTAPPSSSTTTSTTSPGLLD